MRIAKTKRDAVLYDNNPNRTKFIPKGEVVDVLDDKLDGDLVVIRYRGMTCILNLTDVDISEVSVDD